jgi:hypothetical protein
LKPNKQGIGLRGGTLKELIRLYGLCLKT